MDEAKGRASVEVCLRVGARMPSSGQRDRCVDFVRRDAFTGAWAACCVAFRLAVDEVGENVSGGSSSLRISKVSIRSASPYEVGENLCGLKLMPPVITSTGATFASPPPIGNAQKRHKQPKALDPLRLGKSRDSR